MTNTHNILICDFLEEMNSSEVTGSISIAKSSPALAIAPPKRGPIVSRPEHKRHLNQFLRGLL